jgi:SAM-dependent methyltransferase/alkylhydroperoxidase family enzyme
MTMTTPGAPDVANEAQDWRVVDEGWGRRAVDFATLSEPANCREYVTMHQRLGVASGDRVLDMACGAGLAVELARARGATCAGIDASARLVQVASDRNPTADLRVGDMCVLPWDDGVFDVVTSFRGIWGTTPDAVAEAHRVLAPGGRFGITVWGHIKASTGAWALAPFSLASPPKVANQAAMVALGRPGVGEDLLAGAGFVDIERVDVPFVWEFADPAAFARGLASTGPGYEAIRTVGEEAFTRYASELAGERVRVGLPLRAAISVVGYLARKPATAAAASDRVHLEDQDSPDAGFLAVPAPSIEAQSLFDDDVNEVGCVMNVSKLWAYLPATVEGLFGLMGEAAHAAALTFRQRGILVAACASALGDSYCSLAWGTKLAAEAGEDIAGDVLRGEDSRLDPSEQALARWARQIARDPNATRAGDVQALRDAGYDDAQIFAVTAFVAFRIAFSTVNDALGTRPDRMLGDKAPTAVRKAVTFGRPLGVGDGTS